MSHSRRPTVNADALGRHGDVSAVNLTAKTVFDAAVKNFVKPLSSKYQTLVSFQDGIVDLREKGASYRQIAQLLTQAGITVSHQTVARFCRAVIKTSHQPRSKRRRMSVTPSSRPSATHVTGIDEMPTHECQAIVSPKGTALVPQASQPSPIVSNPFVASKKRRGPRIADPRNV